MRKWVSEAVFNGGGGGSKGRRERLSRRDRTGRQIGEEETGGGRTAVQPRLLTLSVPEH